MPQSSKTTPYTAKRKRQAAHIARSYRERGASLAKAERIAWATVDKQDRGGKRPRALRSRTGAQS